MDRRVKERLVGASILVVLIVLIVPELLSGPASPPTAVRLPVNTPEPVRNVTVDLATNKAPTQQPTLEPAAAPGGQASSTQRPGEHAQAPLAEPPAVLPAASLPAAAMPHSASSAPLETELPPPTSVPGGSKSGGGGRAWAVQLGSFANRANADKLGRQLKSQGFMVYVSSSGSGPAARYRVRVGPMADRGAAAQTVAKLKALGQAASIVQPGA
ncbi:MAG: SPOR domain-containing protein [Gammaproteobacteria bacterium]